MLNHRTTVVIRESSSSPVDQAIVEKKDSNIYVPKTFRADSVYSQRRADILPAYPLAKADSNRVILLLANVMNVNRDTRENESFCGGHGICPFEFREHHFMDSVESFMIDLYRDLFVGPSRLWKINASLIDYNLSRLRRCMHMYTTQTNESALASFDELSIALEFYLQIDGK